MTLTIALIVDILLLLQSLWFVLQVSELSVFNPSLWYLGLHAFSVTFRLVALVAGAQSAWFIGIRSDTELVNAAVASDISLLGVVAATMVAAHVMSRGIGNSAADATVVRLNPRLGQAISILCLIFGTYALVKFGAVAMTAKARGVGLSSPDVGGVDLSSLPRIIAGFAVQGALIQCAMRGFTRWRVVLLLALIALSSANLARAFFVLPVLMAVLIYQTIHRKRTLSLRWIILLAAVGFLWFVFKPIAHGIATGDNVGKIYYDARNYFDDAIDNGSGDTQFLDMQATYMAGADETGKRFYGATILPIVYLPIPRFLWPDKPPLNEYASEVSTTSRPMLEDGMTPTLSGESYLNFGWIGCAVIPFLYIYGMQAAYHRVSNHGIGSASRWIYLVFLVSMIQIFRDGLVSLVLFPMLNYLPLFSWGAISKLLAPIPERISHFNMRLPLSTLPTEVNRAS